MDRPSFISNQARIKSGSVLVFAFILWGLVIGSTWSLLPFWPDADGYTSHVAEGRWVAHPPGYLVFVLVGHGFHALGLPAYPSVQVSSLFFTIGALPILYGLFRRGCRPQTAILLVASFAFSWNVLVLSRTGTSHAGDFLTVSLLLLLATSPRFRNGQFGICLLYGGAIVLCAGLRLTTAIMMIPFFALVLWRNYRNANLWIAYTLAGLAVIALQASVVRLSGGWIPYSGYSEAMHMVNRPSSMVLSGINGATLLNVIRTLAWWAMSFSFLLFIPLAVLWRNQTHRRGGPRKDVAGSRSRMNALTTGLAKLNPIQRELFLYGAISALGCLGMAALYLCTHPGYISAALPGTFACLAVLVPHLSARVSTTIFAAYFSFTLAFFLLIRPFSHPSSAIQAAANGLLLQYTGSAMKNSLFKTTSGWLREIGQDHLLPENRKADLDREAREKNPPPF